jgi:hypothetical protein
LSRSWGRPPGIGVMILAPRDQDHKESPLKLYWSICGSSFQGSLASHDGLGLCVSLQALVVHVEGPGGGDAGGAGEGDSPDLVGF